MANKDRSDILMMANYKNVIPYSRLRELVGYFVSTYLYNHNLEAGIAVGLNKESVITEIIYLATQDGEITQEGIDKIIKKWSQENAK